MILTRGIHRFIERDFTRYRWAAIFEYLNARSRPRLDRSEELKIAKSSQNTLFTMTNFAVCPTQHFNYLASNL